MRVRVIESKRTLANCYTGDLLNNKVYEVVSVEKNFYRIVDESGEDYIYHKDLFEIVEE